MTVSESTLSTIVMLACCIGALASVAIVQTGEQSFAWVGAVAMSAALAAMLVIAHRRFGRRPAPDGSPPRP